MSWNLSSRRALAAVVVLGLLAAVGVAGAVSVAHVDAPDEAEVNSTVTAVVELDDLYANESEWELEGFTHLRNATWTVEHYQRDSLEATEEYDGTSFIHGPIDQRDSDAPDLIRVEVTGEVPVPDEHVYGENETFTAIDLLQVYDDGVEWNVIDTWEAVHYSQASRDAEAALDAANATIEEEREAGSDVSEAESTFSDAVSAYESGDHDQAISLAEDAEQQAQEGASDSDGGGEDGDGTDGDDGGASSSDADDGGGSSDDGSDDGGDATDDGASAGESGDDDSDDDGGGLLSIVIGVVVLGLLAGGGYWYAQQQKGPSRDPLG